MEVQPDIYELLKVFSGADAFWKIFYDKDIQNKLNYEFKDVGKYWSQNCFCCCHKPMSEFKNEEEYEDYENDNDIWDCCYQHHKNIEAYNDILKIIEDCKNFDGYVFLNMEMVIHNINMIGNYNHPYISGDEQHFNKELVLLLKEPGETMNFESICNVFGKIKKTIFEMGKYHFDRRSFYFEGIHEIKNMNYYKKYLERDITTETDSYNTSLIGMMQKMNKHYEHRDKYAEYSSDMFYEIEINSNDDSKYKLFGVSWGS